MKRLLAVLLAICALLTLSGCGSLFEDEYYYEAPYSGDMGPRSDRATEVRNYSMLKTALTNMIVNHTETGELRFTNYNGNPNEDLAAACFEIKSQHPLGAYAVETLSYDTSYVVSYYMANIYIGYKRTAEELRSIVYSSDKEDFNRNLEEAAIGLAPSLVIRCYDAEVDEDYVREHLKRLYYENPVDTVVEPEAEVTGYPAEGENRIFDIQLHYGISAQRIIPMSLALQTKLGEAARSMEETEQPALALECAAYLSEACAGGSAESPYAGTAYGALVNGNADSKGYALAYRALCKELDIDCTVVEGSFGTIRSEPHFWNIIGLNGDCYHVDVSAYADDPAAAFLRSDDELWGAYIWDTAAYPACGGELTYAEVAGIPVSDETEAEGETEGEGAAAGSSAASQPQEPVPPEGDEHPQEPTPPQGTESPAPETPPEDPEETPTPKEDSSLPAKEAEKTP